MANFSQAKSYSTYGYPVNAYEDSGLFKRVEPLLTTEQLIGRFLLGIPLPVSFTEEILKDRINLAMNEFELLVKTPLIDTLFDDKLPYDAMLYKQFIHLNVSHKPIQQLLAVEISSSDQETLYVVPQEWVEGANFKRGLINIIPLLSTFGATSGTNQAGGVIQDAGLVFIATLGQLVWLPAFWRVIYTSGIARNEGQVPIIANNLIGAIAAIDILSNLASLNIATSVSASQDGVGQSSSNPGPNVYNTRIEQLEEKRKNT